LREEQALIKTEDRLSRNLDDVDFTEGITKEICRLGTSKVLEEMVIALDLSDIRKEHARRMEYLCRIRDGSENELGDGYWLCKAVAADIEHKQVIPLYCEPYSQEAEDCTSENDHLLRAIDTVSRYAGSRGIWAIDRGGDRGIIFRKFLHKGEVKCFVVRLQKRGDLVHRGVKKNGYELAQALACPFKVTLITYEDGKEKLSTVCYNAASVKLPGRDERLFLVVVILSWTSSMVRYSHNSTSSDLGVLIKLSA
jgi:hypothetical protein